VIRFVSGIIPIYLLRGSEYFVMLQDCGLEYKQVLRSAKARVIAGIQLWRIGNVQVMIIHRLDGITDCARIAFASFVMSDSTPDKSMIMFRNVVTLHFADACACLH